MPLRAPASGSLALPTVLRRLDGIELNLNPRLVDGTPAFVSPEMPPLASDADPDTLDFACWLIPANQDTLIYPTQPFTVIEN